MAKTTNRLLDRARHYARSGERARLTLVIALVAGSFAACTSGPQTRIGAIYPSEGGQGPGGIHEWRGVQLALERSGLEGVELVLEPTDSADQAPAAVERLHDQGIRIVLGGYGSTISNAGTNTAARNGMLWWETGAVGPFGMQSSPGENVFRLPATGEVLGRNAVDFVTEVDIPGKGRNPAELNYSIIFVDDVYGASVANGARQRLSELGLRIHRDIGYNLRTVDWAKTIDDLQGTDVLIVSAYLEDAIAMRTQTIDAGLELVSSIGTSSSYCMLEFGHKMGEDAVGLYASDKPDGAVVKPEMLTEEAAGDLEWFNAAYTDRFDLEVTAPALAGFSAALVLFREILGSGVKANVADVAKAAAALDIGSDDLPSASGVRFAPNGDNERAAAVIWKWVRPGEREVVWPKAYATV